MKSKKPTKTNSYQNQFQKKMKIIQLIAMESIYREKKQKNEQSYYEKHVLNIQDQPITKSNYSTHNKKERVKKSNTNKKCKSKNKQIQYINHHQMHGQKELFNQSNCLSAPKYIQKKGYSKTKNQKIEGEIKNDKNKNYFKKMRKQKQKIHLSSFEQIYERNNNKQDKIIDQFIKKKNDKFYHVESKKGKLFTMDQKGRKLQLPSYCSNGDFYLQSASKQENFNHLNIYEKQGKQDYTQPQLKLQKLNLKGLHFINLSQDFYQAILSSESNSLLINPQKVNESKTKNNEKQKQQFPSYLSSSIQSQVSCSQESYLNSSELNEILRRQNCSYFEVEQQYDSEKSRSQLKDLSLNLNTSELSQNIPSEIRESYENNYLFHSDQQCQYESFEINKNLHEQSEEEENQKLEKTIERNQVIDEEDSAIKVQSIFNECSINRQMKDDSDSYARESESSQLYKFQSYLQVEASKEREKLLIEKELLSQDQPQNEKERLQQKSNLICAVCLTEINLDEGNYEIIIDPVSKEQKNYICSEVNRLIVENEANQSYLTIARKLPCEHIFHNSCIAQWFSSKGQCPNCRERVYSSLDSSELLQNISYESQLIFQQIEDSNENIIYSLNEIPRLHQDLQIDIIDQISFSQEYDHNQTFLIQSQEISIHMDNIDDNAFDQPQ